MRGVSFYFFLLSLCLWCLHGSRGISKIKFLPKQHKEKEKEIFIEETWEGLRELTNLERFRIYTKKKSNIKIFHHPLAQDEETHLSQSLCDLSNLKFCFLISLRHLPEIEDFSFTIEIKLKKKTTISYVISNESI